MLGCKSLSSLWWKINHSIYNGFKSFWQRALIVIHLCFHKTTFLWSSLWMTPKFLVKTKLLKSKNASSEIISINFAIAISSHCIVYERSHSVWQKGLAIQQFSQDKFSLNCHSLLKKQKRAFLALLISSSIGTMP